MTIASRASEFFQQVRQETAKVTWPSRKETGYTTMMVFVMVFACSIFFLLVDYIFAWATRLLLGIGGCGDDAQLAGGAWLFGLRAQDRPVDPRAGPDQGHGREVFRSAGADRG